MTHIQIALHSFSTRGIYISEKERDDGVEGLPCTVSVHAVHPFIKLFHFYLHNRGCVFFKNRTGEEGGEKKNGITQNA